eukprot:7607924-Alexandrium_andersonii.AAC.1
MGKDLGDRPDTPNTPGPHGPDLLGAGRRHSVCIQHSPNDVASKLLPARLRTGGARQFGLAQG